MYEPAFLIFLKWTFSSRCRRFSTFRVRVWVCVGLCVSDIPDGTPASFVNSVVAFGQFAVRGDFVFSTAIVVVHCSLLGPKPWQTRFERALVPKTLFNFCQTHTHRRQTKGSSAKEQQSTSCAACDGRLFVVDDDDDDTAKDVNGIGIERKRGRERTARREWECTAHCRE